MPNVNAPFGFQERAGSAASPTFEQIQEVIAPTTAAIYWNDPVFRMADGSVAGAVTGPGPGTGVLCGIFQGCQYMSVALQRKVWSRWWPAADVNTAVPIICWVAESGLARFLVQAGNSTTVGFTQADVGMNAQFGYGAGNPANGMSGAFIDMSIARAVTGNLPFRIISLVTDPPGANGTQAGPYNYAVVGLNNAESRSLAAQA